MYFKICFSIYLAASVAKYCEKGVVNQSAASAASPDCVKFQAVIKSAASAASRKPKSREEKYVEDVKQDEKHVPDLLESIMRPADPVKEELRQKLFKMIQFGSKISKSKVSTFWIPEIQSFRAAGQCQPAHQ